MLFQVLKMKSPNHPHEGSDMTPNRGKNRYTNILACKKIQQPWIKYYLTSRMFMDIVTQNISMIDLNVFSMLNFSANKTNAVHLIFSLAHLISYFLVSIVASITMVLLVYWKEINTVSVQNEHTHVLSVMY